MSDRVPDLFGRDCEGSYMRREADYAQLADRLPVLPTPDPGDQRLPELREPAPKPANTKHRLKLGPLLCLVAHDNSRIWMLDLLGWHLDMRRSPSRSAKPAR